jgi:hypothetical protein
MRIRHQEQEMTRMKDKKVKPLIWALIALLLMAAGCSKAGSSPTATARDYYEAARKKDVAAMKSLMSKKLLDLLDKAVKTQNKSLDDLLRENSDAEPPPPTFESRNEKVNGDNASLEVNQDGKGRWQTINFVKEDGAWKIDH